MGVGYATNDDAEIRNDLVDYFYCGEEDETVDFWGYNIYSWCGDSSFEESGYDKVVKDFTGFSVPVFFAEYGCNKVQPRPFTEVKALFGDKMTPVISGGILYMYFQEANDYGLVEIEDGKAKKLKDFGTLKGQMAKIDPKGTTFDNYTAKNVELRECPSVTKNWKSSSEKLPPTPNRELCKCMVKSLSCTAKEDIDEEELGGLFNSVCVEQLSHAFNTYYELNDRDSTACDFDGAAELQKAEEPEGNCATLIEQAGEHGSGSVGATPTGGDGDGDGEGGKSAASSLAIPGFNFDVLSLSAYLVCAVVVGAGVVFM
ncbi:1,3-beta-glucanosyltransferase gas1 [Onygenales sp. PD_12]|nr:1,3-beta-glucanosyltransferase gas1 [Onygenales sp. PD_12]